MSKKQSLDKIPKDFKKEDFRFLLLFKLLKEHAQTELRKEHGNIPDQLLNDICADAAKDLLIKREQSPTLEEINEITVRLQSKLNKTR